MNPEPQIIKTPFKETIYQNDNQKISSSGYIYHFIYDDKEYKLKWFENKPDSVYISVYSINDDELIFENIPYQNNQLRFIVSYLITEENIDQFYIYINKTGYTKVDFKKFI